MKKAILFLILIVSVTANAQQSLKDLLFKGKLKNDSGTVVRKSDDLSTKIDTTTKKPAQSEKTTVVTSSNDSADAGTAVSESNNSNTSSTAASPDNVTASTGSTSPKDNNKIWKEYIDSFATTLKTEALPNKKIKNGTYYLLVDYDIDVNGQVNINNVSCSPENSFLQQTVKERLILTAPQMMPVLSAYGKPRKATKKYTLTLTK